MKIKYFVFDKKSDDLRWFIRKIKHELGHLHIVSHDPPEELINGDLVIRFVNLKNYDIIVKLEGPKEIINDMDFLFHPSYKKLREINSNK